MKYYCPKYFDPREFVPPEAYEALGDSCLLVMDCRMLKTADALRGFFGVPVIINDWHMHGIRKYSGFRPVDCATGAHWSQHRFGRALDMIIKTIAPEEARTQIIQAKNHFPYITAMERDTTPWVHVDCRAIFGDGIVLFDP